MLFKKFIFIGFLLVILTFVSNLYGVLGWEKPVRISLNQYFNKHPDVYQDNNLTLITWTSYKNRVPYIYFKYKDTSWHKSVLITKLNKNKIVHPSIAFKNGNIFIAVSDDNNILQLYHKNIDSKKAFKKITLASNEKFSILPNFHDINNNVFLFFQKYENEKKFKINYFKNISTNQFSYEPKTLIEISGQEHGSFFPVIQFHNNKIYAVCIDRLGKENLRNDVVSLKHSSDGYSQWSQSIILSENNIDARFPDFIIHNEKLYMVYHTTEYAENKYDSYLNIKIFDLVNFSPLHSDKISLKFSDIYNLKLRHSRGKFYILWYSYVKRNPQIFNIESDNFKQWSSPYQITKQGNNKLIRCTRQNKMALVYERHYKTKSLVYFQEKDITCLSPRLYSTTHKSNKWSYKNSVIFKWKEPYDISGISGYAYLMDKNPDSIPDIENLPSNFSGKSFENLENGIYYLHLKAIDKVGNFSPVKRYKVKINSSVPEPPRIFSETHKEFQPSQKNSPKLYWVMKDDRPIKGFSYLLTQDKEAVPNKKINTKRTKVQFKNLKQGIWYFKIRVRDPYNRWSDLSSFTLSIEKMIIAVKPQIGAESRFSYIVKPGDVLSNVLIKILKIQKRNEWRDYEKEVGKFNYIQNLDFLNPGDIIMFPIIIAKPTDTLEKISRDIYGTEAQKDKIIIVGENKDELSPGDKIIIKDKFFLKTGNMPR